MFSKSLLSSRSALQLRGPCFREGRRFKQKVVQPLPPPIRVDPDLYSSPTFEEGQTQGMADKSSYFPPITAFRTSETDPVRVVII